jgi:hypothetical protein
MTKSAIALLTGIVLVLQVPAALAWGNTGHRVIGAIAEEYLTAPALAEIQELLEGESIALASTWADEMRSSPDNRIFWGNDYTANWHYINIPEGVPLADALRSDRGDALAALETFAAILRDETVPAGPVAEGLRYYFGNQDLHSRPVKQFALKFMLHIIGDLQQPLHCGHEADRGGSTVIVSWFGNPTNLHTVWDTSLVEQQGFSYSELADKLDRNIRRMPASDIHQIESAEPRVWISEGINLNREVYDVERWQSAFSYAYAFEFVPVVENRMIIGGLRMAHFLNSLFDH